MQILSNQRINSRQSSSNHRNQGLSLIEILVALGIVGILAAVSVPTYNEHVKRGHRANAKNTLVQMASAMVRLYTESGSYNGSNSGGAPSPNFFPAYSPIDGSKKQYDLSIASTQHTYTLTATPIATSTMRGEGSFTLDYRGVKTFDGNDGWD